VRFEYQTAISALTALPLTTASGYAGPSARASAGYLARLANGRSTFVASAGLHPHALATLRTYAAGFGAEVVEVALRDGVTDADDWGAAIDAAGTDLGAVFLAQPNVLGAVEDVAALMAARPEGAVGVAAYDPIPLGVLAPPGACGVDVCVGEGQSLGNRLDFGGPSFGFFAATEAYLRKMPGRIAGETVDLDGRRGFVLTLQTREQHIRREKATSNICTAQALNALAGVVYLAWLGRRGIVELGELLLARTHYAREALSALDGVEALHGQPVVREFALRLDVAGSAALDAVLARCQAAGVNPGVPLARLGLEPAGGDGAGPGLLVAITERRSRADIDRLAEVLGAAVAAERASTGSARREAVGA
jgi:glycine dehydrogenase subunit 1